MRAGAVLCLAALGCAPAPRPAVDAEAAVDWPAGVLRPGLRAQGATRLQGEIAVLEGDDQTISGVMGALGLRFDAERNDLAAITARYAAEVKDAPGLLVLFTSFADVGVAGPAYFVPIHNDVPGTGMGPVDQRAEFGVRSLEGLVNMKLLDGHAPEEALDDLAHEVAHRHLAYLRARTAGSTLSVSLTGRQGSHWTAGLDSGGSLLGGYPWLETTPGHFLVLERAPGFSPLDRYGLGLLEAQEVPPFFLIQRPRTEAGSDLPPGAVLFPGARALGERLDLGIEDVVRELGPRPAAPREMHLMFALLTAPNESATSSATLAGVERIDRLRIGFEAHWSERTGGLSTACTTLACGSAPPPVPDSDGCDCNSARGGEPAGLLLLALGTGTLRRRWRAPSCARCRWRGRWRDRAAASSAD